MDAIEKLKNAKEVLTDMLEDQENMPDDTAAIEHTLRLMGEG
jgi:hypothetical protein